MLSITIDEVVELRLSHVHHFSTPSAIPGPIVIRVADLTMADILESMLTGGRWEARKDGKTFFCADGKIRLVPGIVQMLEITGTVIDVS